MSNAALYGALGGFATGIIVGFVTERVRYSNDLKLERRRIVSPILSEVYPILERMLADASYASELQERNDVLRFKNMVESIIDDLEQYRLWDDKYRGSGFSLHLSHLDRNLIQSLSSLRVHALNAKLQDRTYVIGILEKICTTSHECMSGIRRF